MTAAEIKQSLKEISGGKIMLNLSEIADFLGTDPRKAKSIMNGYNYLTGRSHLYFIDDVAKAIMENSTNSSKKENNNKPTYSKIKTEKTDYYSSEINYL